MSLYNMINGMNSLAVITVSAILGFRLDKEVPRFRDVFTKDTEEPRLKGVDYDFIVYCRMGGGNYACWNDNESENCDCPYHKILKIENQEWCIKQFDDTFDCTYRNLIGKFNPKQKKLWLKVKEKGLGVIKHKVLKLYPELAKLESQGEKKNENK